MIIDHCHDQLLIIRYDQLSLPWSTVHHTLWSLIMLWETVDHTLMIIDHSYEEAIDHTWCMMYDVWHYHVVMKVIVTTIIQLVWFEGKQRSALKCLYCHRALILLTRLKWRIWHLLRWSRSKISFRSAPFTQVIYFHIADSSTDGSRCNFHLQE